MCDMLQYFAGQSEHLFFRKTFNTVFCKSASSMLWEIPEISIHSFLEYCLFFQHFLSNLVIWSTDSLLTFLEVSRSDSSFVNLFFKFRSSESIVQSLLLKYLSFYWIIPIPLFRCFLVSWGSFLWLMPYSRDYLWQLFFQIKMTSSEVLLHSFRCLRYWFYVFYWYYGLSFIS